MGSVASATMMAWPRARALRCCGRRVVFEDPPSFALLVWSSFLSRVFLFRRSLPFSFVRPPSPSSMLAFATLSAASLVSVALGAVEHSASTLTHPALAAAASASSAAAGAVTSPLPLTAYTYSYDAIVSAASRANWRRF